MIKNDILLRVANGTITERPAVWIMRQAGRILPEYRALRSKFGDFKSFIYNSEATAEATLQPIKALDVDAAIIFSDILVIPEALGCVYNMIESRGPVFDNPIDSVSKINSLNSPDKALSSLSYVFDSISIVKRELNNEIPLIGFAGAPWTIFAYMTEGKGSKDFSKAKKMLYSNSEISHQLLQKITNITILYLQEKVKRGCQVIQLFDSWAGILSPIQFQQFSIPYLKQICDAFPEVPVIVFAKGAMLNLNLINELNCQVIGLDWNINMYEARNQLGTTRVLQGNLDPCAMYANMKDIEIETLSIIKQAGKHHIFNLGHGVYPDTDPQKVKAMVDLIKKYRY